MIVIPGKCVFIHVPKTGGTWVQQVLAKGAPASWGVRQTSGLHDTISALRPEERFLPAFAFVRNPFSWYVSLFSMWMNTWKSGRANVAEGPGEFGGRGAQTEHERVWAAVLMGLPGGPAGFQEAVLERGLFLHPGARGLQSMIAGPHSSFSEVLLRLVGGGTRLCRYENLRHELHAALLTFCGDLPETLVYMIQDAPAVHKSAHEKIRAYYTPEIEERVWAADEDVLIHMKYSLGEDDAAG